MGKAGLSAGLGVAENAATSAFRAGLNKAARDIADSHVTTGQVVDAAGNKVGKPVLSGNNAAVTPAIEQYLREIGAEMPGFGAVHPTAEHVESKIAWAMRFRAEVSHADVVINNPKGVCRGNLSCDAIVPKILPTGKTMTVWYPTPNGLSSYTIVGKGRL